MPRPFDPSVLFERWKQDPTLVPFRTEAAALDAVARRAKGIYQTGVAIGDVAAGSTELVQLLRAAFERGLAVTFVHRPIAALPWDQQVPDVYVLPLDQTWRISAINALWETAAAEGWSFAAEAQHSALLGYTPAQRARWLAHVRARQVGYGCLTVYTLLSPAQRATTQGLGKRALGSVRELVGRELFFHRERELLRTDAFARVPRGQTLARVGIDWKLAARLFGAAELRMPRGLARATVTRGLAQRVADGLATHVQLLTRRGWQ
jgi:hypothetical protein